jgi:hypothetical protein
MKQILIPALILLASEFNRRGGKGGFKGARFLYRTALLGLTLSTLAFLNTGSWIVSLIVLVLNLSLFWLPITFFGNDIHSHWFNIPWLYILGFLDGMKSFPVFYPHIIFGLLMCALYGVVFAQLMISDIKVDGLCERLYGGLRAVLTIIK